MMKLSTITTVLCWATMTHIWKGYRFWLVKPVLTSSAYIYSVVILCVCFCWFVILPMTSARSRQTRQTSTFISEHTSAEQQDIAMKHNFSSISSAELIYQKWSRDKWFISINCYLISCNQHFKYLMLLNCDKKLYEVCEDACVKCHEKLYMWF